MYIHAIKKLNVHFSFRSPEEILCQEMEQITIDMHIKGSETYKRFVIIKKYKLIILFNLALSEFLLQVINQS